MYDEEKHRKYDAPGGEEIKFEEETALGKIKGVLGSAGGKVLSPIKRFWWAILILLVVLVAGYFLADFFVFNIKTVEVRIEDTEGNLIDNATVKIADEYSFSGSETLQLRVGEYPIKVSASGYKSPSQNSITVSGDETIAITLEKDMDVDLDLEGDFPPQLFTGEERIVTISITNNGSDALELDLVFEGGFGSRYMDVEYTKPLTVAHGTIELDLTLKVKEDISEKDNLEGTIRIKYLHEKIEARFDLIKFDERKVETIPRSLSFGRISPGDVGRKTVEIENKNNFDMTGIELEIDIDSTQYTDEELVEAWFHFSPSATVDLPAGEERSITIEVKPLLTDVGNIPPEEEESISGNLIIRTNYWSKNISLTLKVKPTIVRLVVEGLKSTYSIVYDEDISDYPKDPQQITLKNNGDVPIAGIDIIPLPEKGNFCGTTTEWIQFNKTHFAEIGTARGENEEDIIFIIDVPSTQPRDETTICEFKIRYNNPLVIGERETLAGCCQFIIQTR